MKPAIRHATVADRPALAEVLFADYPGEERQALLVALAGSAWVAEREGRIVGGCAADLQPGEIGYITGPGINGGELATTGDELLCAAHVWCREKGAKLLQSLLPSAEHPAAAFLLRAGYSHASDLLYLVATLREGEAPAEPFGEHAPPRPSARQEPRPPSLVAYGGPSDHARFAEILARTYVSSLDASPAADRRSLDETLAGYAATGESGCGLWFFLQEADRDVGCLLLADYPALRQWELVYVGLVPESRGQGYGLAAIRRALELARQAGRERLVLAVDKANSPAVAMYARAGFEAWNRRAVFLKTVGGKDDHCAT